MLFLGHGKIIRLALVWSRQEGCLVTGRVAGKGVTRHHVVSLAPRARARVHRIPESDAPITWLVRDAKRTAPGAERGPVLAHFAGKLDARTKQAKSADFLPANAWFRKACLPNRPLAEPDSEIRVRFFAPPEFFKTIGQTRS